MYKKTYAKTPTLSQDESQRNAIHFFDNKADNNEKSPVSLRLKLANKQLSSACS